NLHPVVLHAVEATPSAPPHLDWLPAGATGATHEQRVDSLSAAALERAVTDLAKSFGTGDQTRWLDPVHTTTYMSESAADLPPQPFENRGVYGLLAAYPAPAAARASAGTTGVVSPLRRLPATGTTEGPAALGAVAAGLFLWRRR